jgi:HPt (histidine-containing phosphotransfer) domain-containing protein
MDDYVPKPIELEVLGRALAAAAAQVARRRAGEAVINPARIEQLRAIGEDASLLEEVLASFLGEAPQLLDTLARAVRERDGALLASTAHYLQSSIDFVGANRMRLPCANLELMGKGGTFEEADGQLADLTRAFEEARTALQGLQGGGL